MELWVTVAEELVSGLATQFKFQSLFCGGLIVLSTWAMRPRENSLPKPLAQGRSPIGAH